jgi:polysaccharide biosynthesis transport protein
MMTRKRSLIIAVVVTLAGVVASWLLIPRKFKAQAKLQLVAQAPMVLFRTVETDTTGDDYRRYQLTQLALVKSQLVLNAALLDRDVSRFHMIREQIDPIAWLQENVKADFVVGSEVMEISLTGDDPVEIAGVVNAIKKAYMDEIVNADTKRRADRHTKLKSISDNYADILRERRERLYRLREQRGAKDPDFRAIVIQETLSSRYTSLRAQRVQLAMEQAKAEALLARRKQSAGSKSEQLRKEIGELEDKLAVLTAHQKVVETELEQVMRESRKFAAQSADVLQLEDEIAQFEQMSRQVASEVEALNVELQAPPRVRTVEDAVPPAAEEPWGIAASVSLQ